MTLLQDIRAFPQAVQELLQTKFGINSAEAFFEHATRNSAGMQTAISVPAKELQRLSQLVEGHLPPDFVKRCRQPVKKHARGVIVD